MFDNWSGWRCSSEHVTFTSGPRLPVGAQSSDRGVPGLPVVNKWKNFFCVYRQRLRGLTVQAAAAHKKNRITSACSICCEDVWGEKSLPPSLTKEHNFLNLQRVERVSACSYPSRYLRRRCPQGPSSPSTKKKHALLESWTTLQPALHHKATSATLPSPAAFSDHVTQPCTLPCR